LWKTLINSLNKVVDLGFFVGYNKSKVVISGTKWFKGYIDTDYEYSLNFKL